MHIIRVKSDGAAEYRSKSHQDSVMANFSGVRLIMHCLLLFTMGL